MIEGVIMRGQLPVKAAMVALLFLGGAVGLAAPASAATIVGTPNLTTYCKVNVGSVWYAASYNWSSPYGWRCTNVYTHGQVQIDVNKACRQQFGSGSYATVVAYRQDGWRCVR